MEVVDLQFSGLKLIRPAIFGDDRGFFLETYNVARYAEAGISQTFVQDNHSRSVKGTVRGLHYQSHPGQAKLVHVTVGHIWAVALDIRVGSSTFGEWQGIDLDAEKKEQLFLPIGFAHGFCALSDAAEVQYKCSALYDPSTECSIFYADPELAVPWPVEQPKLSLRDQRAESFASFRARAQK